MGELVSFYSPDKEGVQSDDEAIVYAERHVEDGDEGGYGYTHCDWCGDEWPCTTAALLYMNAELRLELSKAEDSLALAMFDVDELDRIRKGGESR